MTTLEQLRAKKEQIYAIASKNGVKDLQVFGSVVHGNDTLKSDIDFLGNIKDGYDFFDFGGCQIELEELLGRKVDLVPADSIHHLIKSKVFAEAVTL